MKIRDIVCEIPGGWYGSNPGFNSNYPKTGHVAVNPDKAHLSIDYLRRKVRAVISKIEVIDECNGHSILITYQLR